MENQHRHIKGYRELDESEIIHMNRIKEMSNAVGNLVEALRLQKHNDQRWISIGATNLQQGFMALTRAVAKPDLF